MKIGIELSVEFQKSLLQKKLERNAPISEFH